MRVRLSFEPWAIVHRLLSHDSEMNQGASSEMQGPRKSGGHPLIASMGRVATFDRIEDIPI